ncbi:hypothetical protein Hanom_Chr07g00612291 [Helianthus anomalus]
MNSSALSLNSDGLEWTTSSSNAILLQLKSKSYADKITLRELKRCFGGLQLGLLTRDQVSRNLRAMSTTPARDLCFAGNIECGDTDLLFMTKLIDRAVQTARHTKIVRRSFEKAR